MTADFIRFLETGVVRDDLFAPDVFADLSLPQWRLQTTTAADILAVRTEGHPSPGEVSVGRVESTRHGFTIEFEERWSHEGQRWYAREMIRVDVVGDSIVELAIYCTGDWDEAKQREHHDLVTLSRP
ncbi:hypothetical protein [Actinomycetospora sp.]|uniref:hypothetical protein n=1 Tax=Actinomycetospora sp. TaxID=1872135 RepID=UPI002F41A6D6